MFRAVLDTCTLWPSLRRDVILTLASARLFEPAWSSEILEELEYHEARKLIEREVPENEAWERATRLVRNMESAFPGARTHNNGIWTPPAGLPDPDDAHVIAAAVLGGAGAIVTDNIKDFPGDLLPPNIDVITPAAFIADSVGIDCSVARAALIEMLNRRRNPPMSFHALLATLEERYQLHEACELLRSTDTET